MALYKQKPKTNLQVKYNQDLKNPQIFKLAAWVGCCGSCFLSFGHASPCWAQVLWAGRPTAVRSHNSSPIFTLPVVFKPDFQTNVKLVKTPVMEPYPQRFWFRGSGVWPQNLQIQHFQAARWSTTHWKLPPKSTSVPFSLACDNKSVIFWQRLCVGKHNCKSTEIQCVLGYTVALQWPWLPCVGCVRVSPKENSK